MCFFEVYPCSAEVVSIIELKQAGRVLFVGSPRSIIDLPVIVYPLPQLG